MHCFGPEVLFTKEELCCEMFGFLFFFFLMIPVVYPVY